MEYEKYIENAKNDRMSLAVLETAELLLKQPIDSIKMTDIAKASKVGVASLYRYFGTKTCIIIKAACILWQRLRTLFDGVFDCGYYSDKTGASQFYELLKVSIVLYSSHKDFLRFLSDFDNFILQEQVDMKALDEYDASIMDFRELYNVAVQKGIADGTLKENIDYRTLFQAVSHALILMSEKFTKGELLSSDNFNGSDELQLIINMTMSYVRKEG